MKEKLEHRNIVDSRNRQHQEDVKTDFHDQGSLEKKEEIHRVHQRISTTTRSPELSRLNQSTPVYPSHSRT
jgi:hypothetical protein